MSEGDKTERQHIFDSLYPPGGERWFRIKIHSQDKAMSALRFYGTENEHSKKFIDEVGYEVTSITIREEYAPQIAALFDLKATVIGSLYGQVPDHIIESVHQQFKDKMDELKKQITRTEPVV